LYLRIPNLLMHLRIQYIFEEVFFQNDTTSLCCGSRVLLSLVLRSDNWADEFRGSSCKRDPSSHAGNQGTRRPTVRVHESPPCDIAKWFCFNIVGIRWVSIDSSCPVLLGFLHEKQGCHPHAERHPALSAQTCSMLCAPPVRLGGAPETGKTGQHGQGSNFIHY
jgi:hypothetical protein